MATGAGRWSRAAACLLAAVALAACTGTPDPEPSTSADTTTASPEPSVSVAPGPTADGNRRLRLTTVARVPLVGLLSVDRLALSGGRAVLSGCTRCVPGEAGALHEVDLGTGRVRRVAVSAFEAGAVVPSGLAGDQLVWLDLEPVTARFNGRTRWRLQLLDLRSGRSRTLTASGATRSVPPWAVVGGGQVAWQEWSGDALGGPVRVADLRTGVTRLVRDLPGPIGAVSGGAVFYVGPATPDGQPVDIGNVETPADAFALPLPGGPPTALSATRDVGSVTTDGLTAVWTTPRERPTTVWAGRVGGGGAARVVYRGVTTERAVVRDAVAVLTSVDAVVEVAPLEGGPRITVPDVPLADAGLAADGTRLAWVAAPGRDVPVDRQRPLELVVVEVR